MKSIFEDNTKYNVDEVDLSLFIEPLRKYFMTIKNVLNRYEQEKKFGFPKLLKTGNSLYKDKYLEYKNKYLKYKKKYLQLKEKIKKLEK